MKEVTFTHSSRQRFIGMAILTFLISLLLIIIIPFDFFAFMWEKALWVCIFFIVLLLSPLILMGNRSFFMKITIAENEIRYKSLFKKYAFAIDDLLDIYIVWNKPDPVFSGLRPGTIEIQTLSQANAAHAFDYLILLPFEWSGIYNKGVLSGVKYWFFPTAKNYITFSYRKELDNILKNLIKEVKTKKEKEAFLRNVTSINYDKREKQITLEQIADILNISSKKAIKQINKKKK